MNADAYVIVDNTDPAIAYTSPNEIEHAWFNIDADPNTEPAGNYGHPYNFTVQAQQYEGTIMFDFEGTDITAWGCWNNFAASPTLGVTTPSYQCFVDNVRVDSVDPLSTNSLANQVLCRGRNLSHTRHTFRLELTQPTIDTRPFFFDRFEYAPLPNASTAGRNLRVDDRHPAFLFVGDGWIDWYDQARGTRTPESYIDFNFSGTGLTWYGIRPSNGVTSSAAEASYYLDDHEATKFTLNGTNASDPDYFYQVLFNISSLPAGDHKIRVVHHGNSSQTPLTIDFVAIEGGGARSLLPSDTNASNPPPLSTANVPNDQGSNPDPDAVHKKPPVGAIIGIAVATVILVATLACVVFVFHTRCRRRKTATQAWPQPRLDDSTPVGDPVYAQEPHGKRPLLTIASPPEVPFSEKRRLMLISPESSSPGMTTSPSTSATHVGHDNLPSATPLSSRPVPANDASNVLDHVLNNPPAPPSGLPDPNPSRVVQHEDSGLRLRAETGSRLPPVVDLPPQYTFL